MGAAAGTFDPYTPGSDDRYEAMAAIRARGGFEVTAAGTYLASADAVTVALQSVEHVVGSFVDTTRMHDDDVPIPAIPEPAHGRIRRVVNSVLAPHRMPGILPFAEQLAAQLVDAALELADAHGVVDLVEHVVDPFPSAVIARALGVPVGDHDRFRRWSDELLANQQRGVTGSMADAHPAFARYIDDAIDRRLTADDPPDDVITRFLRTEVDGVRLSPRAVRTQTMFLIVAGNETTRNLLTNLLHRMATTPALHARLREDAGAIPLAVEESLRVDSPVQVLARQVTADLDVGGRALCRGERVVLGLASANRDERVHDDPTSFRLDRPRPREHLAFGAGPHICPGATLARAEAVALIGAFCRRVPSLRLADGFVPEPNPVFWALGHRRLPVVIGR